MLRKPLFCISYRFYIDSIRRVAVALEVRSSHNTAVLKFFDVGSWTSMYIVYATGSAFGLHTQSNFDTNIEILLLGQCGRDRYSLLNAYCE